MATLKITNFNGELGANRKYYQFTASLPARHLLCGFVCSVQPPPVDSIYKDLEHSWRIAKTRSLVRDYEAFMAAPILHQSRTQVTVVCSRKFYNSGAFEKLIVDYGFKFDYAIDHVVDSTIQSVLQFTILARLSPLWNTVLTGILMYGPHFLTNGCATPTVKFDVSIHGNAAKFMLQPLKMKIPHLQVTDLEIEPTKLYDFATKTMHTVSADQFDLEWVYTLPTLRQGRVVSVSHQIPPNTPFKTYKDFHRMWFEVHGYYLPNPSDDAAAPSPAGPYVTVKYTSATSNTVDDIEYTFPALCVRPYQPIFYRNVDQNGVVGSFLIGFKQCNTTFCDFPFELEGSQLSKIMGSNVPKQKNAATSRLAHDDDVSDIVATIRQQQNIKAQQMLLLAQQSVAQSDEFFKRREIRPNSAPGFVLQNEVRAHPVAVNPRVVPPGLQAFSFAPAQMTPQYMNVTKLVPIPLGASMPVISAEQHCVSPAETDVRRKSLPATSDQTQSLPPPVSNAAESPMRPTSAFFASSVSQPPSSTSSHAPKRSASFSGKIKGPWPIAAKKCAVDVNTLDMAAMVYRGRVGTLGVQTLKDWLNKMQVPYSYRYRKDQLIEVVINYIKSLDMPEPPVE